MSPTVGDWNRLSAGNEDAAYRSVEPHLEASEEPVVIVVVRPKVGRASTLTFARIEVTPATVELPKLCAFAVTSRRILVVSHDLAPDHTSAVVMTSPLSEVRSVELGRALGAKELSWTAADRQYALSVNERTAKQVAQALQPATI